MPNHIINPDWVRDEVILALDLYFREKSARGNHSHPEVKKLSSFLNQLPLVPIEKRNIKFRNPNGVGMKLSNFQRLDPEYKGVGLSGGNKLEELVWNEFNLQKERLTNTVNAIHNNYKSEGISAIIQQIEEDDEAPEGKLLTAVHYFKERNKALVNRKKSHIFKKYGNLKCEVCGFDFENIYGMQGKGFIECHHEIPISTLSENSTTNIKDLRLVCSNCHRIIHRSKPWLSVSQLKAILESIKINFFQN